MSKNNFTKKDLIDLLIKKASGFYYNEEQFEFEKDQKPRKNQTNQVNMFDSLDPLKKVGTHCRKTDNCDDKIELSNEKKQKKRQENEELTLVKKKVATHFIPPDMLAIKILFEIIEKKVDESEIENMSDEELLKLKTKLLEELKNDDIQNL